ncbi:MAG: RDD family protein [Gammaproteobacteria bacterium]|nr:RDD family protein [Gammaproteobacteria bacterium]
MLYDSLILIALWWLVSAAFLLFTGGEAVGKSSPLYHLHQLALALTTLLFFAGFWSHGGQTLGMRAWRFKVIGIDGAPLGFGAALKRAAAALLSLAPAGLGFWWALVDRDRLAWHDRLSSSKLVRII